MRKNESGLSLIDLLVSVAIISILGSMIVTQIAAFAVRTENAAAVSDLRLAAQAQETLKATYGSYGASEAAQLPGFGFFGYGSLLMGPGNPEYPNILSTRDAEGNAQGIAIQLSNNVNFIAENDVFGTTYLMHAKHLLGDTVFALEAESKAIHMYKSPEFVGLTLLMLPIGCCPSELIDLGFPQWRPL